MSKRLTTICDRCGRFGESGFVVITLGWQLDGYNKTAGAPLDICKNCKSEIDEWINDPKRKKVA